MGPPFTLPDLLTAASTLHPERTAVIADGRRLNYTALEALSNRLAAALRRSGVKKGNRVGIYVPKSLASVVGVFGIMKSGASYVPFDPMAPAKRLAYMARDCGISTLVSTTRMATNLQEILSEGCPLKSIVLADPDSQPGKERPPSPKPAGVVVSNWDEVLSMPPSPLDDVSLVESDTAYILYTSGSTGNPKGVMISHRNSLTFVKWAAKDARLGPDDRVACHAPLHFDLSTFSIFSSCMAGSEIVLVPEGTSMFPTKLAELIDREGISVWYSVPSVLTLMVLYGDLAAHNLSSLRTIIFAGEVFPMKYLQRLMSLLPKARYLNWYGPTETNVCTSYEVSTLDSGRTSPLPIGKACASAEVFAINDEGIEMEQPGERGELYVRGPSVMQGYWGDPDKTARVLVLNPLDPASPTLVYRTGDIVSLQPDGNYLYVGRRDGMVKTRGYRVETGEIESVLYAHPAIKEAVVLPVPDELFGNLLRAIISLHEGTTLNREQLVDYCKQRLPHYMIPEIVEFRTSLPKTSTGKADRAALAKEVPHG